MLNLNEKLAAGKGTQASSGDVYKVSAKFLRSFFFLPACVREKRKGKKKQKTYFSTSSLSLSLSLSLVGSYSR